MVLLPRQEVYWSNYTMFLYIAIAILSFFLPNSFIINVHTNRGKFKLPIGLIIDTIILIGLRGFSAVGRDSLGDYQWNFYSSTSLNSFSDKSVELGYQIINVLFFKLFQDYRVFLVLVTIMTIIPVSLIAWKYHDKVDMDIAMGLYVSCWYFQGLSLLRIYLAASIALIAFVYEVEGDAKRSFFWLVVSFFFHRTAILLFIPWLLIFSKLFDKKIWFSLVAIVLSLAFIFRDQLIPLISETNDGRYSQYVSTRGGFGLQQLLYYLPIILLAFYCYLVNKNIDRKIVDSFSSYIFSGFGIGMLQYAIPILGRAQALFLPIAFIVGACYTSLKIKEKTDVLIVFKTLIIIYGIVRLVLYISGYYNLDDIMPYSTFFGWRF